MRNLIRQSIAEPKTRQTALEILRPTAADDSESMALEIAHWVRMHFRYVREPEEMISTPAASLREIEEHGFFFGDCDDVAVFLAALLVAIGIPVHLVAIRTDLEQPNFNHVFLEADLGIWVPFDLTLPEGADIRAVEQIVMDV